MPETIQVLRETGGKNYTDHLFIEKASVEGGYIADILEPHDSSRRDNLGKVKGLAEYAKKIAASAGLN